MSPLVFALACTHAPDPHDTDRGGDSDTDADADGDTDSDTDADTDTTDTLPDCGTGEAATGWQPTVHITSGGQDRTYALYVPPDWDATRRWPIVFAFHGDGGTGAGLRGYFGIEEAASDQAIVVYPDATQSSGRSFDIETPYADNADMHLFVDILGSLETSHCADPDRVYAAGHSRGGYFVNFMNCRLGDTYLKAIAAHSGSGPYGGNDDFDENGHFICQETAVAALMVHGEDDGVVLYEYGEYSYGQWTWANHCDQSTSPYDPSPCVARDGCDAGKPVVWCGIPGMGHEVWSEAGAVTWQFFDSVR